MAREVGRDMGGTERIPLCKILDKYKSTRIMNKAGYIPAIIRSSAQVKPAERFIAVLAPELA